MPKQNFQSLQRTTHIKRFVGLQLGLAKKDSAARTLMEIYGPPGIGKTVLLEQMRDEANRLGWAFANLNSKLTTVKDILNAFIECSSLAPIRPSLSKISNNDSAQPLTEARQKILEHIKNANEPERPLIIFCDDMDQVNYQLPGLKSELFEPLILSGDCLVVWAARAKSYWQSVEIGLNKLDAIPLAPFSSDEHAWLMQANLSPSITWPIGLEYLAGYPILVAKWIELLQAEPSDPEAKLNDLLSSALKFSVNHALETVSKSWQSYWPALSVIRHISKNILDACIETTLSPVEYNSLLNELKKQGLLTNDSQGSFLSTQFALLLQTHFKRIDDGTIRQVAQRAYDHHYKFFLDHPTDDASNSIETRWLLNVLEILYYGVIAKKEACSDLHTACQWLMRAVRNNQIQADNATSHFHMLLQSLNDEDQWRMHQNDPTFLEQFKNIICRYMDEL